MLSLLWAPIGLELLIPIALLTILALGRATSDAAWLLTAVSIGLYLSAIGMAGLWLLLPWYTPIVYGLILVGALFLSVRHAESRSRWPRNTVGWSVLAARGVVCALMVWLVAYAASGLRSPQSAIDLRFPLRQGNYLVVNGGSNTLVNAHLEMLTAARFHAYRGSAHGVDIVRLNSLGFRAHGLLPADPKQYIIFGDSIFAPCGGEVVEALDGVQEMSPPRTDRAHMAGNHVLIRCGEVWVLLGHMERGSVSVTKGQLVKAGAFLGCVGNTGNTNEPHLHIHAQTPGTAREPLSGDPLPIKFNGAFPVRNDRLRAGD